MDIRGVLLDLDGVVLDSFRDGLRRIQMLCALHDVPFGRAERAKLIGVWGKPGIELLKEGLDINEALARQMYVGWEKMDKVSLPPLIPGARPVLVWLRRNGFRAALITSRHRESMLEMLDRHDITNEFLAITSKEDCPYHKPDPRVFRHALETLHEKCGIEKCQCLFVGDTPSDTVAGQNAELETLLVQTGPYLLEHITEHPFPPGNILMSIDNLPMWIEKHHDGELKELYQ